MNETQEKELIEIWQRQGQYRSIAEYFAKKSDTQ